MTKPVRFLIVSIVLLAMLGLSLKNDPRQAVAGKVISVLKTESTVGSASSDPSSPKNLILLEFFSGL
ncbi:MAG: hypothetical protein HZB50_18060 [Chloroflexi bacterium]|nr:hypothetical protein [Chloroflexota bacterium]